LSKLLEEGHSKLESAQLTMEGPVTDKVLAEIGADSVPRIRVFNKIDYLDA
jgi:50S ribosomal subunit-associated GTPase HflX